MRLLAFLLALATICQAQEYYLQASYSGPTFFDHFNFWTSADPTFGYVHYVDRGTAIANGMIDPNSNLARWAVESHQVLDPYTNLGRLSTRLTSVQSWTHGLFLIDLQHMPPNQCGVWPALWSLGSGFWPTTGEIDMIEFTNNQANNLMALHTSSEPNCTVAGTDETGTLITADCGHGDGYDGCGVSATTPNNIGYDFNAAGGGIYAMEWTSTFIKMWFFPRGQIPSSILESNGIIAPDTSLFGVPMANFQGSCNIDTHFYNHSLIFDTDFCGSYAGNLWQTQGCPMLVANNGWQSCNQYVALNPQAFEDSYWQVNYLNIYQTTPGAATTSSSSLSSVTPATQTSSVSTALSGAQGRSSTPSGTPSPVTTTPVSTPAVVSSALSSVSSIASATSTLNFLPPPPTSLSGLAASAPVSLLVPQVTISIPSSVGSSDTAPAVIVVVTSTTLVREKRQVGDRWTTCDRFSGRPSRAELDQYLKAAVSQDEVAEGSFEEDIPCPAPLPMPCSVSPRHIAAEQTPDEVLPAAPHPEQTEPSLLTPIPPPAIPYVGPGGTVYEHPPNHVRDATATGIPVETHQTAFTVNGPTAPPAVPYVGTNSIVSVPTKRHDHEPITVDNCAPSAGFGAGEAEIDCVGTEAVEKRTAFAPDNGNHLLPGGGIGNCGVPGQNCHVHQGHDDAIQACDDEAEGLANSADPHARDIVTVTTYVVASVETIYRLPWTFHFFTYSPSITTGPLTARVVEEGPPFTPTFFPYEPECHDITVTRASDGAVVTPLPFTPTTFPYQPDCSFITILEPDVVEMKRPRPRTRRDAQYPSKTIIWPGAATLTSPPTDAALPQSSAKRDAPEPTLINSIGDQKRSSGSTTAVESSVTCTPVVEIQNGKETRVGCQLPPEVPVTKSELILVANSTLTISAPTSVSGSNLHVANPVATLPNSDHGNAPMVVGPIAETANASVRLSSLCASIAAGALAIVALIM